MGKIKTYKRGISAFISSEKGQRFFNFAYSIGAAIVIWGALFKILHLPGGNALLSIGMGTEVLMFILTAFDRPPKEYNWEDVFPALRKDNGGAADGTPAAVVAAGTAAAPAAANASATTDCVAQIEDIAAQMQQLRETTKALNEASAALLESFKAVTDNSANIGESSRGYVEQMQNLHRNINGLNTIYELQLRSVSSQIDSIDRINRGIKDIRDMYEKSANQSARYCEETERMARYMQQLNGIYERMIAAMTVNMYHPGVMPTPPDINSVSVNPEAAIHNGARQQTQTANV